MVQAKSLLSSKTFWWAIIKAVGAVLLTFQTVYPQLGWIAMAASGIDVLIRLNTSQPITGTQS